MESQVSGHQYLAIRERLADKLEEIRWDPYSKSFVIGFCESTVLARSSD